jgi:hypothetical protein
MMKSNLKPSCDIAEPAQPVDRCARRDRIGLAAPGLDVRERPLPALADADVEAVVDELDLGAHEPAHQDVADAVVDGVGEGDPALLHEAAFHADLRRDRRHLAGVVRLHAADRDQRVGAGGDRVGHDVLELAQLVAAESEAGIAVLAFRIELDRAAEMRGQTVEPLDRGRPKGERVAGKFLEHCRNCLSEQSRCDCSRSLAQCAPQDGACATPRGPHKRDVITAKGRA